MKSSLSLWAARTICTALLAITLPALAATPDFSGKWLSESTQNQLLTSDGKLPPLLPAAKETLATHQASAKANNFNFDPVSHCLPPGVPRLNSNAQPFLILQRPNRVLMVYQFQRLVRQIYMLGTQPENPDPAFLGNSVAHWQDDTLVIESNGFKSAGLLDNVGTPYSKALQITERWRLRDANTLQAVVDINDASNFSAPWQVTYLFRKQTGTELTEDTCADRTWPKRLEQQKRMETAAQ
ncbi:MAG: hypothetical protein QM808_00305 [Steroidobacteraceae bacterium]